MIIRENKIIDQFPTPKHQQIWPPFWKLLAFNYDHRAVIIAGWSEAPSQSWRSIFDNRQCNYTKLEKSPFTKVVQWTVAYQQILRVRVRIPLKQIFKTLFYCYFLILFLLSFFSVVHIASKKFHVWKGPNMT